MKKIKVKIANPDECEELYQEEKILGKDFHLLTSNFCAYLFDPPNSHRVAFVSLFIYYDRIISALNFNCRNT